MDTLIIDDAAQCLDHAEMGWPMRAALIDANRLVSLGTLLAAAPSLAPASCALVDLTGIGVQDLQIAASVWRRMEESADLSEHES
jgi:ornithine cyclodeaminase/alanine dehydrogenase-like protein (mu-crystallin family)